MEKDLDKKLYNDYLNGEKETFEILYNKYKNKIEYFIYNIVKDYQKAEDIAQETFIYVIQHQMRENSSFLLSSSVIISNTSFSICPSSFVRYFSVISFLLFSTFI